MTNRSRRHFIKLAAGAAACAVGQARSEDNSRTFSFILLGDLHFDQLEHHDFNWLSENHPGDLSQIKNYSKLTSETMPGLFAALKAQIAKLKNSDTPPAFVVQVGDLVEGLCGNEELAMRQNREALGFIRKADLGLPFLFTKGNHDVTGYGATQAFDNTLLPFMKSQAEAIDAKSTRSNANYAITCNDAQFVFFDAYDKESLDWLQSIAENRSAKNWFLVVHLPVVPYGARAMWHLYSDEKSSAKRTKLLEILGNQTAIVLGGHLHKFSALTRVVGKNRFTQLAVSSVVSALDETPRDALHGVDKYTGDQVKLEPHHSPTTEEQRRAIYDSERRQVTHFEYANSAGFAVITINAGRVEAALHSGARQTAFQQVLLSS